MEGVHVKDLPGMPATGKPFHVPCASVGEVRDGKITANRDYWNNDDLLKQLGLRRSATTSPSAAPAAASGEATNSGARHVVN